MKKIVINFIMLIIILYCFQPVQVNAKQLAWEKYYESKDIEVAQEGSSIEIPLVIDESGKTNVVIITKEQCDIDITVSDEAGELWAQFVLPMDSGVYREELENEECRYFYQCEFPLKKGSGYRYRMSFATDNSFQMIIWREGMIKMKPQIILTEGISTTQPPTSYTIQHWESSDEKIVSVSKGKIVGKKKGTATITAYAKDSLAFVWEVSVKENVYKEKQIELSKENKKKKQLQVYKAKYSKNAIVLKVRVLNNTSIKYEKLQNLKVVVKSNKGKKIGTLDVKEKKVTIMPHSVKNLTFVIKKPQIKNANLRYAKITTKGTLYYNK